MKTKSLLRRQIPEITNERWHNTGISAYRNNIHINQSIT